MPIKFKPSAKEFVRKDRFSGVRGTSTMKHYYIKAMSIDSLFEELNKHNTKRKVKSKIRNEITRRGINIIKRPIINE